MHSGLQAFALDFAAGCRQPHGEVLAGQSQGVEFCLEGEKRATLAAGVLGLDMYNMRGALAEAGLKYID
jgi:hypothetical protein